MKTGDRVLIVSINETGTVIGPSEIVKELFAIKPDHPERFTPKTKHCGNEEDELFMRTIHAEGKDLKLLNSKIEKDMSHYNISDTSKLDFQVGDKVRHIATKLIGEVVSVHEDYHGYPEMKVVFEEAHNNAIYRNSKKYFELESEVKEREANWKDVWDKSST